MAKMVLDGNVRKIKENKNYQTFYFAQINQTSRNLAQPLSMAQPHLLHSDLKFKKNVKLITLSNRSENIMKSTHKKKLPYQTGQYLAAIGRGR